MGRIANAASNNSLFAAGTCLSIRCLATIGEYPVKVKDTLRSTVSRSVCLGVNTHAGPRPDFCYSQTFEGLLMWGALYDDRTSAVYRCCWPSTGQLFSSPRPAGLIFYCLRFETLQTWRVRSSYLYPPGTGLSSYTPRHWVPFSSPPTTRRATVEVF
jgi:hypothetical protein